MLYLWKIYIYISFYYICGILKKFAEDKHYQKVRDRCHYTGKYRGAVHSICNLKFIVPNEIPS